MSKEILNLEHVRSSHVFCLKWLITCVLDIQKSRNSIASLFMLMFKSKKKVFEIWNEGNVV